MRYAVAAIQPVHADVNVKKMMSLGMNNLFFNTMFSMDNTTTKLVVFPLDKKKSPIIIPLDISLLFMHYTYNYMEKNSKLEICFLSLLAQLQRIAPGKFLTLTNSLNENFFKSISGAKCQQKFWGKI